MCADIMMNHGPQRLTVDSARQLTYKATAPIRTTEEQLYDICCKRIRQEAAGGSLQAECTVPQFIFGLPLFNRRIMRDRVAMRGRSAGRRRSENLPLHRDPAMVKRPVYVDSALGQTSAGRVRLRLANPLKGVSRVRLRDAQIPRLDDITYVAIGLRCGRGAFIDNVQVPYSPTAVTTSGSFSLTGVAPGPPLFAILPIAQASSISSLDYAAGVPYVYLNQERYEFEFKPPLNSMDELEIQLYRPPAPSQPSTFPNYDTTAYLFTLARQTSPVPDGAVVTNKALNALGSLPYYFTAVVIATTGSKLLLGSASSTSAISAFVVFLEQAGLLDQERMLYSVDGTPLAPVSAIQPLAPQTTLNLEFDCAS
ncbi:hypothetical protein WJX74_003224 [Apatococcus lobatus]|uniref:Uncharacterized protein n=1 Tax=Apatococcus lobatus TaxID=904363 RepID=A0AAW1R0V2_9CHLO